MSELSSNLRFTETHEWLDIGDDPMIVGITDHAQQLLGDMVFIELPQVGAEVSAGDELGVLESVKAASDFYAPISGAIVEINQRLVDNPELVNNDPYGEGWLVKIEAHHHEDADTLLSEEEYQNQVSQDH